MLVQKTQKNSGIVRGKTLRVARWKLSIVKSCFEVQ